MQATAKATNLTSFFIGEITSEEADSVRHDNPEIDGFGYYLIAVDNRNPRGVGNVLAKFTDESSARALANVFRSHGLIEV